MAPSILHKVLGIVLTNMIFSMSYNVIIPLSQHACMLETKAHGLTISSNAIYVAVSKPSYIVHAKLVHADFSQSEINANLKTGFSKMSVHVFTSLICKHIGCSR